MSPEQVIEHVGRPHCSLHLKNSWNWYFRLVGLFTWFFFHYVQAVDFKKPVYKEVMAAFAPYFQES